MGILRGAGGMLNVVDRLAETRNVAQSRERQKMSIEERPKKHTQPPENGIERDKRRIHLGAIGRL